MEELSALKAAAARVIDNCGNELRNLSLQLHTRPELNFNEVHAHGLLTDYLERNGFTVTRGAFGLPTAFHAIAGSGSPTVAVLCEYDALPEVGHACGHNLIAASGLAVGLALQHTLPQGEGTIVVLGSPAEEGGGGKIYMAEHHAFDGIDAAMMLHPFPFPAVRPNVVAIHTLEVEFFGKGAHAAAMPHEGVNALDAIVLAYNGISVLRQQLRPDELVHGIITKGGSKPNIIPDHTAGEFYVRARDDRSLSALKARILACFEGAAKATGCRLEYKWIGRQYSNMTTNDAMADAYVSNARSIGMELPADMDMSASSVPFSTDMGNVSHIVPSIHPLFAIETRGGNHTPEFADAAGGESAHREMIAAATALTMTALDLYRKPDLLTAAKKEFQERHSER